MTTQEMDMPKVSIMIPTYNQEDFIRQSIESALSQNYGNLEVIVSDDCSTDSTYRTAAEYLGDSRFRLFRNEMNIGRVENYRKLLYFHASGEWVLMLDGDDYLIDTDFIRDAVISIMDRQDVVLAAGGKVTLYSDGAQKKNYLSKKDCIVDGFNIFNNWYKNPLPHLGCLYKKSLAVKLGFYTEDIICSDWESILKIILHGKVVLISRIVCVWRKHEANVSNQLNKEKVISNLRVVVNSYAIALSLGKDILVLEKWKRNMVFMLFYGNILVLLENSGFKDVITVYKMSYKTERRVFFRLIANTVLTVSLLIRFLFGKKVFCKVRKTYFSLLNMLFNKSI